jgi:hypothetical protein
MVDADLPPLRDALWAELLDLAAGLYVLDPIDSSHMRGNDWLTNEIRPKLPNPVTEAILKGLRQSS